jgi:hypothetical protein
MGTNPDVRVRKGSGLLISAAVALCAAAITFCIKPPEFAWTPVPADPKQLARRIAHHPDDWHASTALAEGALDMRAENRVAVWQAAYEHASLLAPERPEPGNAFAKAAFFHWAELSPKQQHDALTAFAPVMRNPDSFRRMAKPIYELMGELSYLEAVHPPTVNAVETLIWLALPNGFFADYRRLRGELQQRRLDDFNGYRQSVTPSELLARFPDPPYHSDSERLIVALLDELRRRPLRDDPHRAGAVDGIVGYALRHELGPLDGFEVITRTPGSASSETQINLARKLGMATEARQLEMAANDPRRPPTATTTPPTEWQGLCETDVCNRAWRTIDAQHGVSLSIETVQTDSIPAYVEIYLDDALRAEGEVGARRDFVVPTGNSGPHQVEVVLVNPMSRNLFRRRVHIGGITTL